MFKTVKENIVRNHWRGLFSSTRIDNVFRVDKCWASLFHINMLQTRFKSEKKVLPDAILIM